MYEVLYMIVNIEKKELNKDDNNSHKQIRLKEIKRRKASIMHRVHHAVYICVCGRYCFIPILFLQSWDTQKSPGFYDVLDE